MWLKKLRSGLTNLSVKIQSTALHPAAAQNNVSSAKMNSHVFEFHRGATTMLNVSEVPYSEWDTVLAKLKDQDVAD